MSREKLYIPKILNVGYQERNDTYSKKLAYVVYTDDKGVLRKEKSWKSWCEIFLDATENVPTDGFVLNKGVGGARESYGWNSRNEYIRVYDPRGWEFEISVANLLFILQECTSTKGKGLEGEFVYSWSGKDLVLLPVDTEDYRASNEFTANQSKRVDKSEMSAGRTYMNKNSQELLYLGRIECCIGFIGKRNYDDTDFKKRHVFLDLETDKYVFETGFTKLSYVVDTETHEDFTDKLELFLNSFHCNKVESFDWVKTERIGSNGYVKINNDFVRVYTSCHRNNLYVDPRSIITNLEDFQEYQSTYLNQDDAKDFEFYKPVFTLTNGEIM